MEIEKVSKILEKTRIIFEEKGNKIDPVCFRDFPRGACGPSSDIIGQWLLQNGVLGLKYVSGDRGEQAHAWLEYKGYILDITSDQFDDGCGAVFIGKSSKFHDSFKNQRKSELGIAKSLAVPLQRFSEIIEKFLTNL